MSGKSLAGKVQTVLGPIEPDDLGVTMMHEHLLSSFERALDGPEEAGRRAQYEAPLRMDILGQIYHGQADNLYNFKLDDIPTAIEEVGLYKQFGGSGLVDATNIGIGRDPIGLARISRATGVHVIMGSSFYVGATHPGYVDRSSQEELAEGIGEEVLRGVSGTGIRAGIMGEVGCSWPLQANERKVLRATAQAQRKTGAPILIHPGRDQSSPAEILEILLEAGANATRVIVGHLDRTVFERQALKDLANTGCFLEYDFFGEEASYFPAAPHIDILNDAQRLGMMEWLISEGHGGQILVSHDVAKKSQLVKNGGQGYCYFLEYMVPRMRGKGIEEEHIQRILVDNPKRALTFDEPVEAIELT